jgi:hypothetical protein
MKRVLSIVLALFSAFALHAQHDSSYYYSYKSKITARFYFSNKSTSFVVKDIDDYNMNYRPNTTRNLGIGATYKSLTLNLAYGFGFLNQDGGKGKTKYLDLQFHNYGRKLILDVFGQFYKGFYMSPKGYGTSDGSFYYRPDIRINMVGASVQYVFNSNHFSYRASFLQDEWQRKSAGTFLLGFETYVGNVASDSTLFPTALSAKIAARNYTRVSFFELGPNVGYAYTLIFKKYFFFTGSASVSVDLGSNIIKRDGEDEQTTGLNTNTLFRASTGYNSQLWAVSFLYVTNNVHLAHNPAEKRIQLNTSNFRLNFIRRIAPSKKIKKILKVID